MPRSESLQIDETVPANLLTPDQSEKSATFPNRDLCRRLFAAALLRCRSCSSRRSRSGLCGALALLPEPHGLGELGARLRVIRGDHRVIARKVPFCTILLGGHPVGRAQV